MSLEAYEQAACAALKLNHHSANASDILVGSFRICDHPEVFDTLAALRRQNAERILLSSPEMTEGLSEDECYELAYYHVPHGISQYLELVGRMPALEKDVQAGQADKDAYERLLGEIEADMEKRHPGITRSRGSAAYNKVAGPVIQQIKKATGRNIHTIAQRANRHDDKMRQTYSHSDLMFFKDHWQKGRLTPDVGGYLTYIANGFPKYAEMLAQRIPLLVPKDAREKHTYIVGATGSGKSELIKHMVISDFHQGRGAVCVIDPHGDMVEEITQYKGFAEATQARRLIYIDPFLNKKFTPVINPLECENTDPMTREVVADQLVLAFEEMLKGDGGATLSLNMRTLLKPCLLVLLDTPSTTLVDLRVLLNDEHNQYWRQMGVKSSRPSVRDFFLNEFSNPSFVQTKESLRNKLQSLFNASAFYNMVNGPSFFDLAQAIEEKKLILFNLSKGKLGAEASEALGRLIIAMLKGLALRRADIPVQARTPIHLYVDECHNFIGPSIHTILTEARKYKLHLTMAQQVAGDSMSADLKQIVFNNVETLFAGRTKRDSTLPSLLGVPIERLQALETGAFYCRISGGPTMHMQGHRYLHEANFKIHPDDYERVLISQVAAYTCMSDMESDGGDAPVSDPAYATHEGDVYVPDLV